MFCVSRSIQELITIKDHYELAIYLDFSLLYIPVLQQVHTGRRIWGLDISEAYFLTSAGLYAHKHIDVGVEQLVVFNQNHRAFWIQFFKVVA